MADSIDNAILQVQSVTVGYGEAEILFDVSLHLMAGQIVSVIGPNGAGKSTLLKTIFGGLRPRKGKILLRNEDITGRKPNVIVKKGISYVPQVENVFPSLTVQENLEMGAFIRTDNYQTRLEEIFALFPVLSDRKNQKVGYLSGGQRQMVAMGRALMLDPQVILLDEPSAGLAPKFVSMIFDKIKEINLSGVSIILVEQNTREALKMAHYGYVLAMGKNIIEDKAKVLLENEKVGRLYLGG